MGKRRRGDVGPDDSEITAFKLKDVRAPLERDGLRAVQMRIGAESPQEHAQPLTIVRCNVKPALV